MARGANYQLGEQEEAKLARLAQRAGLSKVQVLRALVWHAREIQVTPIFSPEILVESKEVLETANQKVPA